MSDDHTILTPAEFQAQTDVSRETMARLTTYVETLRKWQKAINLVSRKSLDDVWRRHILDSLQVLGHVPKGVPDETKVWFDLGSGAGLPGLILAILGAGEVHLVESDSRKCAFLAEAARLTGTDIILHNCRIEDIWQKFEKPPRVDVITARALADFDTLIEWAQPIATQDTVCLFLKGQDVENELTKSSKKGTLNLEKLPSTTNADSVILRVAGLGQSGSIR
jgi:16S rRNA (guanine527-N7)-methyltransferase